MFLCVHYFLSSMTTEPFGHEYNFWKFVVISERGVHCRLYSDQISVFFSVSAHQQAE